MRVTMTFLMDQAEKRRLKVRAASLNIHMGEILRSITTQYLDDPDVADDDRLNEDEDDD